MGKLRGPEWYNRNGGDGTDHWKELEKSPWYSLYESAANLLPEDKDITIVDLGCGAGRFAKLLFDRRYANYIGVDFCRERIDEAKEYVPEFEFICMDVMKMIPPADSTGVSGSFVDIPKADVYIMLEFLEHIEDDIGVLKSLPEASVIFSVPEHDASSHVRTFPDWNAVVKRYDPYVSMDVALWLMGKYLVKGIIK